MKSSGVLGEWTNSFESNAAIIYALDQDYRLVHCNRAWDRFALENASVSAVRAQLPGRCIFDVIPLSLAGFYRDIYQYVRETRREQTLLMECSSPLVFRRFHMSLRPFGTSGVLTANSLLGEMPHAPDRPLPRAAFPEVPPLNWIWQQTQYSDPAHLGSCDLILQQTETQAC